jgi:hypothetical protein
MFNNLQLFITDIYHGMLKPGMLFSEKSELQHSACGYNKKVSDKISFMLKACVLGCKAIVWQIVAVEIEIAGCSERLIITYQTTRFHSPGDSKLEK